MPTRQLLLLRHAKSSWRDSLPDHERPLSNRGRRSAAEVAQTLRTEGLVPGLVLCSSAQRTLQTLDAIHDSLPVATVKIDAELYLASAEHLLRTLQLVPDEYLSALLIAHNPGLSELVSALDSGPSAAPTVLPTAGLVCLSFEGPWGALTHRCASLDAVWLHPGVRSG